MYIRGEKCKKSFATELDGKKYTELLPNMQKFVKNIFPDIADKDQISCRYINNGKVDIEVGLKGKYKRIMIKAGITNYLHLESIGSFVRYLNEINVPQAIKNNLVRIFFGYPIDENFSNIVNNDPIKYINTVLMQEEYVNPLINRILFHDYYDKEIHYLYYGNLLEGMCISMHDLKERLFEYQNNHHHHCIRIGNLNFKCMLSIKERNKEKVKSHIQCGFKVWNLYSYINRKNKSNP